MAATKKEARPFFLPIDFCFKPVFIWVNIFTRKEDFEYHAQLKFESGATFSVTLRFFLAPACSKNFPNRL